MGVFEKLDMALQKDLIDFVDEEDHRDGKTLGEHLIATILRKLIDGECTITGCCTDHAKKKMFVEYTFKEDDDGE